MAAKFEKTISWIFEPITWLFGIDRLKFNPDKHLWPKIKKYRFAYYFIAPTVLGMLIMHATPILQGIYIAFLRLNQYTLVQYLSAPFVGLTNFQAILFDVDSPIRIGLFDAIRNTLIYTVIVTSATIALGTIAALMVNREFKGKGLVRTLFIFPWVVPTYVTGLLWGFMWQRGIGIINIILYDVLQFHVIAGKINPLLKMSGISWGLSQFNALILFSNQLLTGLMTLLSTIIGFIFVLIYLLPPILNNIVGFFAVLILLSIFVRALLAVYNYLEKLSPRLAFLFFVAAAVFIFCAVFKIQFPAEINADYKPFWLLGGNTMWAIIIPTIWRYWPFSMLMILAGLQSIPEELYEAANIDGASPWKKFWMITWPLLKPVWSILILFGMIYNVYAFNIVYMMFGFGAGFPGEWGDLMMTNIFRNSFQLWNFGAGAATSVILMILMIVAVNIWFRHYQKAEEIQ